MKTLLIANNTTIGKHSGEEYDDYLVYDMFLFPDKINETANQIRNKIRELSMRDEERKVKLFLDVSPPYESIIVGLSHTMKNEEHIDLELPDKLIIDKEYKQKQIELERKIENGKS